MTLCACDCGRSLEGMRANARYASAACRTRDWKRRRGMTGLRYVKASQNAKPAGLQVSLGRARAALVALTPLQESEIDEALKQALPDRQRQLLEEREAA